MAQKKPTITNSSPEQYKGLSNRETQVLYLQHHHYCGRYVVIESSHRFSNTLNSKIKHLVPQSLNFTYCLLERKHSSSRNVHCFFICSLPSYRKCVSFTTFSSRSCPLRLEEVYYCTTHKCALCHQLPKLTLLLFSGHL